MFSTLRTRFGIPGVISVIALVFAMIGGAYAASNSGSGNGATASAKKSAKGPRGPRGPKGATGATGPAGPAGPAGAKGDAGAAGAAGEKGATGDKGAAGTNGQSVTTAVEPPFGECGDQEGVELTSASGTNYVCSGEDGVDGSPWTAGGTLPPGSTETGFWSISTVDTAVFDFGPPLGKIATTPISFSIPLQAALTNTKVHFATDTAASPGGAFSATCTGSAAKPTAPSGHLCVYKKGSLVNLAPHAVLPPLSGADTAGAPLNLAVPAAGNVSGGGTWAVTG